jgi:pyruvate dehydrogenase phosphatase
VSFVVKAAFASDLGPGWTEDMANWPIRYKSYTSEDAFCEALKAIATTDVVSTPNGVVAHTLTLQPFASPASTGNEDRHVVQHWELPCGQWTFIGVFDGAYPDAPSACYRDLSSRWDTGHSGHETSEHTAQCLPSVIRSRLESVLAENPETTSDAIGEALANAVQLFDKSLEDDLKAALPEHFENLSDEELQAVINDQASGGRVYTKMVRCMRGACSVIAIIDPGKENLWIVNLGDCEAGQYLPGP